MSFNNSLTKDIPFVN